MKEILTIFENFRTFSVDFGLSEVSAGHTNLSASDNSMLSFGVP